MKMNQSLYKKILGYDPLHSWKDPLLSLREKLGNVGAMRMFIYSEYLKRKLYADCYIHKNDSKKLVNSFVNDLSVVKIFDNIRNIFLYNEDVHISKQQIEEKYLKRYDGKLDLYSILKYLYLGGYLAIQKIIENNIRKDNPKNRNRNFFRYEFLYTHPYNFYIYERILDRLLNIKSGSSNVPNFYSHFGILVFDIVSLFDIEEHKFLLTLHRKLLHRYHLYFCDLLNITDVTHLLFSKDQSYELPLFFSLPKINGSPLISNNLDMQFDPASSKFTINITHAEKSDISILIHLISRYMASELYTIKSGQGEIFSENDIDYLAKYFDVPNDRNKESDFTDRLIGLYLWDKCYRLDKEKSLSANSHIKNFINKYSITNNGKNKNTVKSLRHFQRILGKKRESIKHGLYLPLA